MKRLILTTIILFCAIISHHELGAQRLFRTEISDTILRADSANFLLFVPSSTIAIGDPDPHLAVDHIVDIPTAWNTKRIFLHLESVGMGYRLCVNGKMVAQCDDPYLPADYEITGFVNDEFNVVTIEMGRSSSTPLNQGVARSETPHRGRFDNCYYYTQNRIDIFDFEASLRPDSVANYATLEIIAVVENSEKEPKSISAGYYLQDPSGRVIANKLDPHTISSCDTIRFSHRIRMGTSNPRLYQLTMVTKVDGRTHRSHPREIALHKDRTDSLHAKRYNATLSKSQSINELDSLKTLGYNTIIPDYPQPMWLYDHCTKVGLYVIDQANINAPSKSDDRAIGGTPSNDPTYLNEYINRVKGCYMRTRNTPSVIAYSLGGDSGNGYTMYKTYEWLKSRETNRPIIYLGADGEWNSDHLEFTEDEY